MSGYDHDVEVDEHGVSCCVEHAEEALAASQPPSGDARCPDCGHPSDAHRYEDGCAWLYNSDPRERCGCARLAMQPPSGDVPNDNPARAAVWYTPDCGHLHLSDDGIVHTRCPDGASGDAPDLREDWAIVRDALPSKAVGPRTSAMLAAAARIDAALAASAPSSPATPAPLEVERLPCGYRWPSGGRCLVFEDHAIHVGGWAGRETQHAYEPLERRKGERRGARAYANQEGGDCEHGIPRNECKLAEHDR